MQNKPKRRWLNLQIILASIAVTFTVGLWNVFARAGSAVVVPAGAQPPDPKFTFTYTPAPTATATLDPKAPVQLPQVHLLLGGKMPVAPVVMASSSSSPDLGSTGGGNSNPPSTNTGSSKKK
jgi:hypothetical protein